jgi:hypothetical protein
VRQFFNQLGKWWCVRMHDAVMWPSHGKYRCRTCRREYVVEFEAAGSRQFNVAGPERPAERRGGMMRLHCGGGTAGNPKVMLRWIGDTSEERLCSAQGVNRWR